MTAQPARCSVRAVGLSWQKTPLVRSPVLSTFRPGHHGLRAGSRCLPWRLSADTRPRVEVVPNGVDCDHNRPGLVQPQPDALVFNGSLTYSANYDAMQLVPGRGLSPHQGAGRPTSP